jgi:hypothetical protein
MICRSPPRPGSRYTPCWMTASGDLRKTPALSSSRAKGEAIHPGHANVGGLPRCTRNDEKNAGWRFAEVSTGIFPALSAPLNLDHNFTCQVTWNAFLYPRFQRFGPASRPRRKQAWDQCFSEVVGYRDCRKRALSRPVYIWPAHDLSAKNAYGDGWAAPGTKYRAAS